MHNIEHVVRRMRLAGSHQAMSPGEIRRVLLYLIQNMEKLENEISLLRSEADSKSGDVVSTSGPKLRGRGRPKSEPEGSSPSGGKGVDSKT